MHLANAATEVIPEGRDRPAKRKDGMMTPDAVGNCHGENGKAENTRSARATVRGRNSKAPAGDATKAIGAKEAKAARASTQAKSALENGTQAVGDTMTFEGQGDAFVIDEIVWSQSSREPRRPPAGLPKNKQAGGRLRALSDAARANSKAC